MLILPRNIQATCLLRRGMPTIFLHLEKFQPAKVGKFQPAETGEYSTGVDNLDLGTVDLLKDGLFA